MFRLRQQKRGSNIVSIYLVLLVICSLLPAGCAESTDVNSPSMATNDLPFVIPDVKEPKFPDNTFRITDFGAVGDGHTKNTEAFAKAIAACVNAGGGKVVVPAGMWLTGPIQLKSNLNLHVEEGAVVLFSPDFEDYPLLRKTWEGLAAVRCMPPLYGEDLENIAFTGPGIFDGSGQAWRPVKRFKMTDVNSTMKWQKMRGSGKKRQNLIFRGF